MRSSISTRRFEAFGRSHRLARIVRLFVPPASHQAEEVGIGVRRQHDAQRRQQIAMATLAGGWQSLAAQAQDAPAARALRNGEFDLAVQCRRANLAAERGFIKRDRQIKPQIAPLDLEQMMRRVADGHQSIAGRAVSKPRLALAAQADLLAFLDADRNGDVERLAGWQGHARRSTGGRHGERNRRGGDDVLAALRAPQTASRLSAEEFGQNVRIDASPGSSAATGLAAAEIEVEMLKARPAAAARPGAAAGAGKALESLITRLALRVDLAPIKSFALFLVADDFVSGPDLGAFVLRFELLALIGMEFLGQPTIGRLYLGGARRLGEPENFIWIAHISPLYAPALRARTPLSSRLCGRCGARTQVAGATLRRSSPSDIAGSEALPGLDPVECDHSVRLLTADRLQHFRPVGDDDARHERPAGPALARECGGDGLKSAATPRIGVGPMRRRLRFARLERLCKDRLGDPPIFHVEIGRQRRGSGLDRTRRIVVHEEFQRNGHGAASKAGSQKTERQKTERR